MNIRKNKLVGLVSGASTVAMMTMVTAFAANPWAGATASITNVLNTLFTALQGIVGVVGMVVLIICGLLMMISKDQKKVDSARSWGTRAFICIVAIYAIPFIINLATQIGQTF